MCTASIRATETRDATHDDDLRLVTDHSGQPYFHRKGDKVELVTCIKHGDRVTLSGVSPTVREELKLPETLCATFAQDPADHFDAIWLEDGRFVSLPELVMEGDVPDVKLVQTLNCALSATFQAACKAYFSHPRMAVVVARESTFEQTSAWNTELVPTHSDDDPHRLTINSLPAGLRADRAVSTPHQAEQLLVDA